MTNPANTEYVKSEIESRVPGCILKDDSAGALLYQFPPTSMGSIPALVQWLETVDGGSSSAIRPAGGPNTNSGRNTPLPVSTSEHQISSGHAATDEPLIHGYGISQTSLEEVFLKLIRDANPDGYQGYEVKKSKKSATGSNKKQESDTTLRNRGTGGH
jgi:hypothetical protein